ncbi:ABC transporter permease [Streptomyces cyslabdanicus]|uniref:ABC transporter permease n=1 Tax=Streptomyces cyslabdanicus TaxID=1470456 RepID=UPI00404435D3
MADLLIFTAKRLALAIVTLWGLATIVFLMIKAIPGDEARVAAGRGASPELVEQVRHRLGLDSSLGTQYFRYLDRLVHGDLGTSIATLRPIRQDLSAVLPSTVELVLAAMVINLVVGIAIGVVAASWRDRTPDFVSRLLAVMWGGMPIFWVGVMLHYLLGTKFGLVPSTGQLSFGVDVPTRTGAVTIDALLAGDLHAFGDALYHLMLPAAIMAAPFCAVTMRTVRSAMLSQLEQEYILVVIAKGASRSRVLLGHALRNALVPSLTIVGLQFGWMVGGTVLVEAIFTRQGIGSYIGSAVTQKDSFAVLGGVLFIGGVVIIASLVVDLLQMVLDPRVRAAEGSAA